MATTEQQNETTTKMKTFIRVRPIQWTESERIVQPEGTSGRRIKLINPDSRAVDKVYRYDHVFGEQAGQEELYTQIVPDMLNSFVDGLNVCLFAYGQTGSGKTYSIMGEHGAAGLLPRFCTALFQEMGDLLDDNFARIEVAFFEVYNEKVYDLLAGTRLELKVRGTDPPQPENLTHYQMHSMKDFDSAIHLGLGNRSTAATKINELSSRSHAIFQIKLVQTRADDVDLVENRLRGRLTLYESNAYFVDLAGSERVNHADSDRSEEGIAINRALLALGNVIKQRARGDKFIAAVRDSLLTRLLKPCFAEGARTCLLATISPLAEAHPFTSKTLEFAENASRIKQAAKRHIRTVDTATGSAAGKNKLMPVLTDISNIPYPRKQCIQWYSEVAKKCTSVESMEIDGGDLSSSLEVPPPEFAVKGPDDLEAVQRIREFFSTQMARRQGLQETLEQNSELFEAKLKERLCTADLDRQRVKELEEELRRLKADSSAQTGQMRQLKRENDALRVRLYNYESQQDQERQREEGQRYLDAEREAAIKSNRRTLQKMAELFESPIPSQSNVARLRKKFGSSDELETVEGIGGGSGGSAVRKTPKMTFADQLSSSPTPKKSRQDGSTTTVRFYDNTNSSRERRSPSSKGFVNPRYQRRSRSVGGNTSRILNHQPANKIPLGTVFQPKLPKSTKYTTQLEAEDLKKHDEYMVTRQEVDSRGHIKTKLFKGEVIPTAGGGTAVHFLDVENLEQETP